MFHVTGNVHHRFFDPIFKLMEADSFRVLKTQNCMDAKLIGFTVTNLCTWKTLRKS